MGTHQFTTPKVVYVGAAHGQSAATATGQISSQAAKR
jgi:hypothetical protein